MKILFIILLIATNVVTGVALFDSKAKITTLEATTTSDAEREAYGEQCVEWLKEQVEDADLPSDDLYLGRSWRKHGQMVFEVIVPAEVRGTASGNPLCTYDLQSGLMFTYAGTNRDPWMFY